MIIGEHSIIRMAEADDAYELRRLYDPTRPRSPMLDRRRETVSPSVDELRDGLAHPERLGGVLYVVEDKTGLIRGFCALRGASLELAYGEAILPLFDDADYETPLAEEVFQYLRRSAFVDRKLNKIVTHGMTGEEAYCAFVRAQGFKSNGVQRQVVWTRGRWHDIETFTLFSDGR